MESEPVVSWAFVELLDASHQTVMKEQSETHGKTVKTLWRIIIGLLVIVILLIGVVGYGVWLFNQYDTISYEQDGNGNNVIGENNRSYYEPADEDSSEEE